MDNHFGDVTLFYQAGDGSIHYTSLSTPEKDWQGVVDLPIKDAKLGTPLACAAISINLVSFVRSISIRVSNYTLLTDGSGTFFTSTNPTPSKASSLNQTP